MHAESLETSEKEAKVKEPAFPQKLLFTLFCMQKKAEYILSKAEDSGRSFRVLNKVMSSLVWFFSWMRIEDYQPTRTNWKVYRVDLGVEHCHVVALSKKNVPSQCAASEDFEVDTVQEFKREFVYHSIEELDPFEVLPIDYGDGNLFLMTAHEWALLTRLNQNKVISVSWGP